LLLRVLLVLLLLGGGLYALGRYGTNDDPTQIAEAPIPRLKPERDWRGILTPQPLDTRPMPSPRRGSTQAQPQVVSRFSGRASYYAQSLHGNLTASGEVYIHEKLTAAHKTLPFGTRVLVTRRDTGQVVMVTINDRGPFVGDRVIDLSGGAAEILGMQSAGVVWVDVEVLPD